MFSLIRISLTLFYLRFKMAVSRGGITVLGVTGFKISPDDLKDQNDLHEFMEKCSNSSDFHDMADKFHNQHFEQWEKVTPSKPRWHFSIGESDHSAVANSDNWIHISRHQPTGEPVGTGVSSVVKNVKNIDGMEEWVPYIGAGGVIIYIGVMLFLWSTTPPSGNKPSPLKDLEEIFKDE